LARTKVILQDALAMVLAGGQGERLYPLTRDRSKPAVPFGGIYRIIDFTLSNCLNSGIRKIFVLTQYRSGSLERHLKMGWDPVMSPELDEWIFTVPPQLRLRQTWYQGTADAIYQNIHLLEDQRPRHVLILSGDHVYKMDYAAMLRRHEESGAVATIAAVDVPLEEATSFGVLHVDERSRIASFQEKPEQPECIPGRPDRALVNMGVYCFDTRALVRALVEDARLPTRHDFGHDILPRLLRTGHVCAHPFVDEERHPLYWRDIGTLDAYYQANLDLLARRPAFDLFDESWPIRTLPRQLPPALVRFPAEADGAVIREAIVSPACVLEGMVERSVLSPQVRVGPRAQVEESVLLDGVEIGEGARVRRVIVDKAVRVPAGAVIGHDPQADRERFAVSPGGVVVVPKGAQLD
jgi:glucose-1-phosphate adenylyltransferase